LDYGTTNLYLHKNIKVKELSNFSETLIIISHINHLKIAFNMGHGANWMYLIAQDTLSKRGHAREQKQLPNIVSGPSRNSQNFVEMFLLIFNSASMAQSWFWPSPCWEAQGSHIIETPPLEMPQHGENKHMPPG
jgi:hypothetical protein